MKKYFSPLYLLFIVIITVQAQQDTESQLKALGIELPAMGPPMGNYVKYVHSGNLVFLSGHGPTGEEFNGKVGIDLTMEEGYNAARSTAINLLATLKTAVGDLNRVKRIVKVTGMVNSAPDFYEQPKVVNGCSDLLTAVFGDKGKHARAAVGMASLPGNIAVEIEMIVEVEE